MAEATRWGKDSVIIRHRLEKLPPNPEIDSPARERASVRNPLSLSPHPSYVSVFFSSSRWKKKKGGRRRLKAYASLFSSQDIPPLATTLSSYYGNNVSIS